MAQESHYPPSFDHADGQSFLGLIAPARSASVPVRTALYQEHRITAAPRPAWRDIRTFPPDPLGAWHYVRYDNGECELYDSIADPNEMSNLCGQPYLANLVIILDARLQTFVTNVKPGVP